VTVVPRHTLARVRIPFEAHKSYDGTSRLPRSGPKTGCRLTTSWAKLRPWHLTRLPISTPPEEKLCF
jgi:hypothetical protein